MNRNYLEEQLKILGSITPSKRLKERITLLTKDLPAREKSFFPLLTFQMGIALAGVILFLVVGSGILAAINTSTPGTVLYSAKKAINSLPAVKMLHLQTQVITPVPRLPVAPTATPTPVIQKGNGEGNSSKDNGKNNNSHGHHSVEGVSTEVVSGKPNGWQKRENNFEQDIENFFHHNHSLGGNKDN